MGFFDRLFAPRLGPEQEQTITGYINAFNLVVSKLHETYTSKAKAEEFAQLWGVAFKEIKGIRVRKKHELYPGIQKFLRDYEHTSEIIASSNATFLDEEKKRYDALLSSIDGKSLDDQQRTVVVEKFYETDFKKITPRPPMGTRIFDLSAVLGLKTLPDTSKIAELLSECSWS